MYADFLISIMPRFVSTFLAPTCVLEGILFHEGGEGGRNIKYVAGITKFVDSSRNM